MLVRLAWHASGTYDKQTNTGGSQGAGMRYEAEGGDPANAGLQHARVFLEQVKEKHPWVTYSECAKSLRDDKRLRLAERER